jgi:hypothetical protein
MVLGAPLAQKQAHSAQALDPTAIKRIVSNDFMLNPRFYVSSWTIVLLIALACKPVYVPGVRQNHL